MSLVSSYHQQPSQQQLAQCENEADALLTKLTIDEVRQVVVRTRADIAARNDALRSFVGEHHRDLVQVADAVIAVHDVSETVLNALNDASAVCLFLFFLWLCRSGWFMIVFVAYRMD